MNTTHATTRRWLAASASIVCLGAGSVAEAQDVTDEPAFSFGNETETFLLGGITGGGSFGSPGAGGFVGGELSMAMLFETVWSGVYVDGAYDFGHGAGTFSAGPELGWGPLGLDGGVGLRIGLRDDPEIGFMARGLITLGLFSIFGRYSYWIPTSEMNPDVMGAHVGQIGVLIKMPLWTSSEVQKIAR